MAEVELSLVVTAAASHFEASLVDEWSRMAEGAEEACDECEGDSTVDGAFLTSLRAADGATTTGAAFVTDAAAVTVDSLLVSACVNGATIGALAMTLIRLPPERRR